MLYGYFPYLSLCLCEQSQTTAAAGPPPGVVAYEQASSKTFNACALTARSVKERKPRPALSHYRNTHTHTHTHGTSILLKKTTQQTKQNKTRRNNTLPPPNLLRQRSYTYPPPPPFLPPPTLPKKELVGRNSATRLLAFALWNPEAARAAVFCSIPPHGPHPPHNPPNPPLSLSLHPLTHPAAFHFPFRPVKETGTPDNDKHKKKKKKKNKHKLYSSASKK